MIDYILREIKYSGEYKGQIVKTFNIERESYEIFDFPSEIDKEIKQKLKKKGILGFYKHQLEAFNLLKKGFNIIITSSTASGKTLSFNIPIVSELSKNEIATALYLYPTKALAQDQLEKISELTNISAFTYDGDTAPQDRQYIRKHGRIVIANPDILHVGLLPNHTLWSRFLINLKFVVIDEAHYYSGVLGSHFSMVLRRLRRLLAYYGSYPQFILSSATLENPLEYSSKLVGEKFELIKGPLNPPFGKLFVIYNPPIVNEALNLRKNIIQEAVNLIEVLLKNNQTVIAFVKSRQGVEILTKLLQERIGNTFSVSPYRAGYSKELRRTIERKLKSGEIKCVVATNALELGIDIGELDATVIVGYPGSISSLFQQSGRSGRTHESITFFLTSSNPLDQYFTKDPEYLFRGKFESLNIDLSNPYILNPHILCASYELPIQWDVDKEYFGDNLKWTLQELERGGLLVRKGDKYFLNGRKSPASQVSLRSSGEDNIRLIDVETNTVIERISKNRALEEAFVGAVYMHLGETYVVKNMDLENREIYLQKEVTDYYTDSLSIETIWVDNILKEKDVFKVKAYFGEVTVEEVIRGFVKKQFFTDRKIETLPLELPKITFKTKALWITIDDKITDKIKKVEDFLGAIHAAEHAMVGVTPLVVQCDRNDIGGVSHPLHPDTGMTTIFLYDGIEGGIGITEKAYDRIEDLLEKALRSVSSCPCKDGCPSCIYSPKCGNENNPLSKNGAIMLLYEILS
ncbi:DEAD/DEAH box helicase [Caldisericum exile]|uniref:ATP-dependent helicase n=1 Tax=Caldisericum exile (strain DSM 21853 / NBRC 104410 / AZM16c01) TaxID=511051 RepID=A0A7U6JFX4_CALEA|nr:DEAD/DEAH box helicase [Caldisericum exile]BAL80944.1 putative ATP-dependent helicase [Caldisericum exile AZM16c01]